MDNNLDIIFLSGLFPKENEKEIFEFSKGNVQHAANNLQWSIALGLDENLDNKVKLLNSLYIGSYPKRYKKLVINSYRFSHLGNANHDLNVGFLNFTGVKNFSRAQSLRPHIKEWALDNGRKKKVLIAYAMTSTFTSLLKYSKQLNPNIITCLIVPDLPQYMNLNKSKKTLYSFLKNYEMKQIEKHMNYIDSYVLLTQYMQKALHVNKPYTVIEGISTDVFRNINNSEFDKNLKTIFYGGGLVKKYGILDLVYAFTSIPTKNYRLIICGSGEAEEEIIEAAKKDSRIIFKGLIPRTEVLRFQQEATLLINPRPNNEEYTKYSFPSKIMEYMSSGTPIVAYSLDGMPDEYDKYFFSIENGIEETLKKVLSMPDKSLIEKGLSAREFVLNYKNGKVQTKKIIDLIKEVKI